MNYGYQNEKDFVELFNKKYFFELDDNSKNFLKDLFRDVIDDDETITSWKNKMSQKQVFLSNIKIILKILVLNVEKVILSITSKFKNNITE